MNTWITGLVGVLCSACARSEKAAPPEAKAPDCPAVVADPAADHSPTKIAMRDVELVIPEGLLRVRHLEGVVVSTVKGQAPIIDDPKGYSITVDHAEVAVDLPTLNKMMGADHSTTGKKAPFASATFSTEGGLLVVTGDKPVPFVLKGAMSVDPKGRLTVSVVDLKALGVQTKGILAALDLKLADLIDVTNQRGVTIDGNVLHIDPLVNMPAPKIDAKVTGVGVEADGLVLRLGDVGTTAPEKPTAVTAKSAADTQGSVTNYVSYNGGTVIQGRMTVRNTDLKLVDLDPTDPLRLSTDALKDQITAGYTKISTTGGMTTFIPDANQLGGPGSVPFAVSAAKAK